MPTDPIRDSSGEQSDFSGLSDAIAGTLLLLTFPVQ